MSDRWVIVALSIIVAGTIAAGVVLATKDARATDAWKVDCRARTGHVLETTDTRVGVGISGSGKPVTTVSTDTTYYCLSDDGRVLDIR